MGKTLLSIVAVVLFVLILAALAIWALKPSNDVNNLTVNNSSTIKSSFEYSPEIYTNFPGEIPTKDKVVNPINWSKYQNIGYHFIHELRIAGPNDVINHTFLLVSMRVEIKNPDDVTGLYKELSEIVKQEREILGENSAFEIKGEVDGAVVFYAGILPFSTVIYREDYFHPVNSLTWSNIDVSEVN